MIDHVSIAVKNLSKATEFYESILLPIGLNKMAEFPDRAAFGDKYPEFWINQRANMDTLPKDTGAHVCLRAKTTNAVDEFYAQGIGLGAVCSGKPGLRPEYNKMYYAAFLQDIDGNKIEAVTFVDE